MVLSPAEQNVHRIIEDLAPDYVKFLQELIRIPSTTGDEQKCQALVRQKMRSLGIFDKTVFSGNQAPFLPTGRVYKNRPNLVGKITGKGNSHFILNAHIDTAPVEDENTWLHPPYGAVIENGKLYGRGALDDKAGTAIMLLIAETFLQCDLKFQGNLYFESVIEDEDSGNGTLACTMAGYHCDGGIIIDGTWPFRTIDSHLGQIQLECQIQGVPAAACSHKRGINPVELSMEFFSRMKNFVRERNKICGKWLNIEEPFFLNMGEIHAGVWSGSVPERCTFKMQIGFPPPAAPDSILEELLKLASRFQEENPKITISLKRQNLFVPPFSNPENKMTQLVRETVCRLRKGATFANLAVTGHSDLRHLRKADGLLADACLYGPGGGENPHARNEYYLLEHFVPVAQNISSVILDWYKI